MSNSATLNGLPVSGVLHRKFGGYTATLTFKDTPPAELIGALFSEERQPFTFTGPVARSRGQTHTTQLYCLGPAERFTVGETPRTYEFGDAVFMAEWDRLRAAVERISANRTT